MYAQSLLYCYKEGGRCGVKRESLRGSTKQIAALGILFGVAIALSFLESLVPSVLVAAPGIKLGLSNVVTMYCLFYLGRGQAWIIAVLKSVFVLLFRGVTASLLSLSGGICSLLIMIALMATSKKASYGLVSVVGAIFHNLGQLWIASVLLSSVVFSYLPVLIVSGIIMGLITGKLLKIVLPVLHKLPTGSNHL